MESNGSSTEYSTISRLGEVDPEECDALADVFLGTPVSDPTPDEEAGDEHEVGSRPRVLQLVVGSHLTHSDALFSRFCQFESVNPDRAIGCINHVGAGWSARLIGRGHRFNGRRATVAHAIGQVSATADHVNILLPPYREVGQLIDGLDGLSDPPDRIIVLSTADESDVVAAYRQIKSIAAFCREQIERTTVALIDEPGPAAEAALGRLMDTAARFLDARITGLVVPEDASDWAPATDADQPNDAQRAEPEDGPATAPQAATPDAPSERHPEPKTAPQSTPELTMPARREEPVSTQPRSFRTDDPLEAEPRSLLDTLTWDMQRLAFRCPEAAQVVYAVDADGRVHAIAAASAIGDLDAQPDPLTALSRARAFITRHMPVLAPLHGNIRSDAGPPVAHLVSARFADLAPWTESDIRLHLAVPVQTAGRTVWGVSELHAD